MLLFLLFLFPLSLAAYYLYRKDPKQVIAIVTGVLIGAVVSGFSFFFKFSHRVVPYSFGLNLLYYIEKMGIVTVIVIFGIFFLLSKDSFEDRIGYFDSLMLACYSVMVPFYVITGNESSVYPGFAIFVKPVIYLAMIFTTGFLLKDFYNAVVNKKIALSILTAVSAVVVMLIPSVIESLYAINFSFMVIILLSAVYALIPAGIQLKTVLLKK